MNTQTHAEPDADSRKLLRVALGLGWLDREGDGSLPAMGKAVTEAVANGSAGEFWKVLLEELVLQIPVPAKPSEVVLRGAKTGRPRLDSRRGFSDQFCRLMPRLSAGEMNLTQAAKEMDMSVRSLKRYAARLEPGEL